jgi:two-component system sensor histidine kinase ChiS
MRGKYSYSLITLPRQPPAMMKIGFMEVLVMIVDDAEWLAATLEIALLVMPDVRIIRAASGGAAWALLQKQAVAVLVTDLRMPGMDGFELIARVRAAAHTRTVPIIVVSSDDTPETQDRVRKLGANAFFAKPCSPAAVRKTLEELLHDTESRAPL